MVGSRPLIVDTLRENLFTRHIWQGRRSFKERERERRGIPLPYRNFFKKEEEEEEEASRFGVAVLYTACNRAWLNNIDRQAKRKKRLGVV